MLNIFFYVLPFFSALNPKFENFRAAFGRGKPNFKLFILKPICSRKAFLLKLVLFFEFQVKTENLSIGLLLHDTKKKEIYEENNFEVD